MVRNLSVIWTPCVRKNGVWRYLIPDELGGAEFVIVVEMQQAHD